MFTVACTYDVARAVVSWLHVPCYCTAAEYSMYASRCPELNSWEQGALLLHGVLQ